MKASQVGKQQQVKLLPVVHCMVCGKAILGYYGRWGNSGTCSRSCENEAEAAFRQTVFQKSDNPVTTDEE